ncbi:DUF317 domain-containing protein [Kitasatospora sp. RG8]|uniref:DUF317 domain-containing protein n=1 Tax=Kitasatospora sp. RG8 TaxID=2820815 RepID=UPI001AE0E420|nr:DUF317 domain-containing protein [Kitasatospora sp. RG8]MBP0450579.1 DUF317 domain-containing protein [Kitasatospora sp. RG8]
MAGHLRPQHTPRDRRRLHHRARLRLHPRARRLPGHPRPDRRSGGDPPTPRRRLEPGPSPSFLTNQSPDRLIRLHRRDNPLQHSAEMAGDTERWLFEVGPPREVWYATASSRLPEHLLQTLTTTITDPAPANRYMRRIDLEHLPSGATATATTPSPLEVARVRAATRRSLSVPRAAPTSLAHSTTTRPHSRRPPPPGAPADHRHLGGQCVRHHRPRPRQRDDREARGRPIGELERPAIHRSVEDPRLRAAIHTRGYLTVVSNIVAVHQARLHALTRPGHVPAFYDFDRITESASSLRTAHAESNTALQTIRHVVDAREAALTTQGGLDAERVRAATSRTTQSPRPLELPAGHPGTPPAAATPAPSPTNRR